MKEKIQTAVRNLGKTVVFIFLGLLLCFLVGLKWLLMVGSIGAWVFSMWVVVDKLYVLYLPSAVNDLHAVSCAMAFVSLIVFVPYLVFNHKKEYVFGGFWFSSLLGIGVTYVFQMIHSDILLVSVPVFSLGALLIVTMIRLKSIYGGKNG